MKIYIDLDGTVVDVYDRYCGILNEYLAPQGLSIPREDYIRMRHDGVNEKDMPHLLLGREADFEDYHQFKHQRLESPQWLATDRIIGDVNLLKDYPCKFVLITQRNNKENALTQIANLGLDKVFDEIVVVKPLAGGNSKAEYLRDKTTPYDCIIGDSKTELECARILGIKGCFVPTGLFGSRITEGEYIGRDYLDCVRHMLGLSEEN